MLFFLGFHILLDVTALDTQDETGSLLQGTPLTEVALTPDGEVDSQIPLDIGDEEVHVSMTATGETRREAVYKRMQAVPETYTYATGLVNSEACPDGAQVLDETECPVYAAAVNLTFVGSANYADRPAGCSFQLSPAQAYWNNGTGSADGEFTTLCKRPTAVNGTVDSVECPDGSSPITTAAACSAHAAANGFQYLGTTHASSWPRNCYINDALGRVKFNTNVDGSGNAANKPFCKVNVAKGVRNSTECPGGSVDITSAADCQAYANLAGLDWQQETTSAKWPGYCYFGLLNENVIYNPNVDGEAHPNNAKLCQVTTTTTTTAPVLLAMSEQTVPETYMYSTGLVNSVACPPGAEPLSQAECPMYAAEAGLTFDGSDDYVNRPAGCSFQLDPAKAYWNNGTGSADGEYAALCKILTSVIGPLNSPDCPGGSSDISTLEACQATAAARGFPFGGSIQAGGWPSNCYVHQDGAAHNTVKFNTHPTGSGHPYNSKLCKLDIVKGKVNTTSVDCPPGSTAFSDAAECEEYATLAGLDWQKAKNMSMWPGGCYFGLLTENVLFNVNATGKEHPNNAPLCKKV